MPGFLSVKEVLSQFNIDGSDLVALFPDGELSLKTRLKNLSGGFRRLVEIYVIIMSPSYFVLLDEPFTHLSPVQIEKIKELIIKEKSSKGFLITDHMYHHVLDVSDSLYVLTDAKTYLTKSVLDIEALGYAKTV
jgi:ABC-type lipopolysaccharide export system ATPase subunit